MLDKMDISYDTYHDAVHHEPDTIRTNDGEPYSVFSYFWKKWTGREKKAPVSSPEPSDFVDRDANSSNDTNALPSLDNFVVDEPTAEIPNAGTETARDRLDTFCDGTIYRYEVDRDYPARGSISRLSQDLKYGTIGIRGVYARTETAMDNADNEIERESVEAYQRQLAWREFYTQVL